MTVSKIILSAIFIFNSAYCFCQLSPREIRTDNKSYRAAMHEEFLDTASTPLTTEGLKDFHHLDFYPVKNKYCVVALLIKTPDALPFEMQRSKGNTGTYRKYGTATFEIDGRSFNLSVYQYMKLLSDEKYKDDLFLPFGDLTNGDQTYGSGRFLELKIPKEDTLIIDFNKAFNPLCAYNSKYSCPIPPSENQLDVAIPAGMRKYKGKH